MNEWWIRGNYQFVKLQRHNLYTKEILIIADKEWTGGLNLRNQIKPSNFIKGMEWMKNLEISIVRRKGIPSIMEGNKVKYSSGVQL